MTEDAVADTPITSRSAFREAVRATLREAAVGDGCRELWLCDLDFASWPLGEAGVVDDLTRWAGRGRPRFHLVATDFEAISRLHPRWVAWRRRWAHVVVCRANTQLEAGRMPTLLLAPGLASIRLFDPGAFRGLASRGAVEAARVRARLDAVLQQSDDAFSAHVTGL